MSSLAPYSHSVGTCLTSLQSHKRNYSLPPLTSYTITTCSYQQLPPLVVQKEENQLKRRDAIGLAFSFGLLHSLFQPLSTSAAEAVPCELTVAPSGLSFCDKIVGTGSQAVKGQLIKVINHFLSSLFPFFSLLIGILC